MLSQPEGFARAFAEAWSARDAEAIAALFAPDGDFLTLTGAWAEGREAIARTLAAEFKGAFARTKLVTGRMKLRPLGPHAAVAMQRFVLSGLLDAQGRDVGRHGAVLTATLLAGKDGWLVAAASFSAEG
ncbi:SgcJ/EcaC family oxidoreductase [Ostreiculturibacter nitratireducens]|uniref:SgcJ/EcaC family oxidoreductase n=1 Tax=Ostreiculturibacter nitratireducens TaxID=3075226 RepID=UPI0031B5EEA6